MSATSYEPTPPPAGETGPLSPAAYHAAEGFAEVQPHEPPRETPAKVSGGSVDEQSLLVAGKHLSGGQGETISATLKPGKYELVCHMPGHYAAGQQMEFTVR
jgi:hypothetical protein